MIITGKTKVSQLIKYDKKAIDVIATINPHFRKLKNPVLRRLLAPRVSIADAARIGGITVAEFLRKLQQNGFEVDISMADNNRDQQSESKEIKVKPNIMERSNIVELDVRPILKGGVDPFKIIMEKLKELDDEQTLLVINSFEPVPLLNILKNKGYEYEVERPEAGVIHAYLKKSGKVENDSTNLSSSPDIEMTFEQVEKKYAGQMKEIDVRDLEMPLPMVTILEELENLTGVTALYVHHKKLPQYLLPELNDRGYNYVHKEVDDNNLKLIIYK